MLSRKGMGHLAWKCPAVCFKCCGDHASDTCPNHRGWECTAADDDDFRSVVSDLSVADDVAADPVEASANSAEAAGTPAAGSTEVSAADGAAANSVPSCPPQMSVSQSSATSGIDDRFNQLDEIQTQSVLNGLSDVVDNICESAISALNSAVGSVSESSSCEDPFVKPQDVSMSEPSVTWKREVSEVLSSDESRERSRSRGRKARATGSHIPSGAAAAANFARSRPSLGVRSSSKS